MTEPINLNEYLENLVTMEHLEERGFHRRGNYMVRQVHQQEVRFINVMDRAYMFDGIYYSKQRPIESYEMEEDDDTSS